MTADNKRTKSELELEAGVEWSSLSCYNDFLMKPGGPLLAMLLLAMGCIPWKLPSSIDGGSDASERPDADAVADADSDVDVDSDGDRDRDVENVGDVDPDVTDDVIARYSFEGNIIDSVGSHNGVTHDDTEPDCLSFGPGHDGGGQALRFSPDCTESYVQIEDDDGWDEVSSIDFWLSIEEYTDHRGVLSRDAQFSETAGHFTIWVTRDSCIVVRHEHDTLQRKVLCSSASLVHGQWVYVGINLGLGGIELWIDGVQQAGEGSVSLGPIVYECEADGREWTHGIEGNGNPWVIGASLVSASEGTAEPREHYARDLAIDELRMGRERRDFADFP